MTVIITGQDLTIADIRAVARGAKVALTHDPAILARIDKSREIIAGGVERGEQIYGVTTLFGGMADQYVGPDLLADVQRIAVWQHKSTTGPRLPAEDVRAAMLLRANSFVKGASGVRREIIERYIAFLNAGAHPHVHQRGSIGASGDLVPLSYIGGAVIGLDPAFLVDLGGETLDAHAALARLGLAPLALQPKEGLALNNGTGASTGIAANATARTLDLASLALGIHALYAQAMLSTDQSFDPFIHAMKPHPGQIWVARQMGRLVDGSKVIRSEAAGGRSHRMGRLIQDRYSLRCLPQYLGPVVDGIATAARQIETEANCANDNPLIDPDTGEIFHTGNFLAQYTGVAMDALRYHVGLIAKHVDAQIALLMTPEFSYGLNPSLVGNMEAGINVGLKSLQIGGNSMMPLMSFYGQSIVDRFPTHAEQFNQNVNSQAMNAANLARETVDVLEHYLAAALMIGVQAVELRAKLVADSYDARKILSEATKPLYLAARKAAGGAPDAARPLHWDDLDGFIQPKVEGILADVAAGGAIMHAVADVRSAWADM
ncbi:aromatic amino acid ammonia-lyase [Mesorhizobium sp. YIM 152430]|uniref:HAL/PAL/TAL family ammonia-lyase n=1 Tax=Mesorhizobium sp. YIM 152430 TaxID=3031761 RepID=UPI0023D9AC57|nr:aromatic amino acid ammonia-lyase [Mesorhizobium sp. YIM 152430]MDF1598657.1 aromatic amino acid ammonia-lyase [Mesorhizobium sp. YIM 152430]